MARLARDSGLNLAGMVVSQAANLATVLVLARSLGDDAVGVYSQAFALRALLMLICGLGTRVSMTHFVARYHADGDVGALRGATRLGIGVTAALSSLVGFGLVLLAEPIAEGMFDDPSLTGPVRLAGVSLPAFTVMTSALAATQGFKTMRAFAGVGLILDPVARFIGAAIAVAVGWGVGGAMWGLVVASVLAAAFAVRSLHRYTARLGPGAPTYHPRELISFSGYSWLATLALQGLLWSDVVILGAFVSSADVGVYQVATRVVLLGTMVTPALTASYSPRVAEAWRRGDQQALRSQYLTLTGWTFRLSLPILMVIIVFPQQILRVFGGAFEDGHTVIWWLVGGAAIDALAAPSGVTLNQANHNRVNMAINVAALVLNVALNLVLIPIHGIDGAAMAWAVSLAVPGIARVIAVERLVTHVSTWTPWQGKAIAAVLGAGGAAWIVEELTPLPWYAEVSLGVIVIGSVYVALLWKFGAAEEDAHAVMAITTGIRARLFRLRRKLEQRRLRTRLDAMATPDRPLPLDQLVSPFRYDIEVRRRFLDLVAEHESSWRHDPDAFIAVAAESDYHTWYRAVAVRSIGVDADDPQELAQGFARRVRKTIAFYDEYHRLGRFDPRYPVTVRPVDGVVGERKQFSGERFVPVDGCHRIAMLLREGRSELSPTEYRIAPASDPVLDNTERLVAELEVSDDDYYRFVSRGFLEVELTDRSELLAAVRATDATLADEVDAIMQIDERSMRRSRSV